MDWIPKTRLGQMVLNGEITTMSDALKTKLLSARRRSTYCSLIYRTRSSTQHGQRMTDSRRRSVAVTCIAGNGRP